MDRETYLRIVAYGVLFNSALYIVLTFWAGLVLWRPHASVLAVATAGVTYLSYNALFAFEQYRLDWIGRVANILVLLSVAMGLAAGIALFVV